MTDCHFFISPKMQMYRGKTTKKLVLRPFIRARHLWNDGGRRLLREPKPKQKALEL